DTEDARYLIFLCGDLMNTLSAEIAKIAAYSPHTRVTREDMDAVAIPQIDAVVFQMTDAMARKDFDKAASVLADLLHSQQPPIMILAAMGKYFRQLY
ncbi:DNA polymerase III subunit delta, partial [Klebsiella oxytoca]